MKRFFLPLLVAVFSLHAMKEVDSNSSEDAGSSENNGDTKYRRSYLSVRPQFISAERRMNAAQEVEVDVGGVLGSFDLWESPKTPCDLFASLIKYLPSEVRQRAWRRFDQQNYLSKGMMTLKEAEDLAKLYTHK